MGVGFNFNADHKSHSADIFYFFNLSELGFKVLALFLYRAQKLFVGYGVDNVICACADYGIRAEGTAVA